MTSEQSKKEKERDQAMGHMQTQIDLLTKRLFGGRLEKVKAMNTFARYDEPRFNFHEDAKFMNNQGGFQTYNSRN